MSSDTFHAFILPKGSVTLFEEFVHEPLFVAQGNGKVKDRKGKRKGLYSRGQTPGLGLSPRTTRAKHRMKEPTICDVHGAKFDFACPKCLAYLSACAAKQQAEAGISL